MTSVQIIAVFIWLIAAYGGIEYWLFRVKKRCTAESKELQKRIKRLEYEIKWLDARYDLSQSKLSPWDEPILSQSEPRRH